MKTGGLYEIIRCYAALSRLQARFDRDKGKFEGKMVSFSGIELLYETPNASH